MKKLIVSMIVVLSVILATCIAYADMPSGVPEEIAKIIHGNDGWAGWTATGYVCPKNGTTAFLSMHKDFTNKLVCFKKQDGKWNLSWNRDNAVPQGENGVELTDRSGSNYAALSLNTAFSFRLAEPGAWESVYELKDDIWKLRAIVYCDTDGSPMDYFIIRSDSVLYSGWRYDHEIKIPGFVETDLRYFSYSSFVKDPDQLKKTLSNPPSIPAGTLSAERIRFTGGKKYEVYQGPGVEYGRAGNGKASVSTNDWIQVFGKENGWIMIQYDITNDHMRIGWIKEAALPRNTRVSPLALSSATSYTISTVSMTDDPLFSQSVVKTLSQGTAVEWLATMGEWAYIECDAGGLIRGFVPKKQLSTNYTFALENYADTTLNNYPLRGTLVLNANGSVSLSITAASSTPNGQTVAGFAVYDQQLSLLLMTAYRNNQGGFTAQCSQSSIADIYEIVPFDETGKEDRTQSLVIKR